MKLNQTNAPLLGMEQIKIFEIGTIFKKSGEKMHVAYNDGDKIIELSLDEFCAEIPEKNSSALLQPVAGTFRLQNSSSAFRMWPLYPFIARDIAVWVPQEVESNQVLKVIKENAGNMVVRGPELFDEFKKLAPPELGGGTKISYAFRIVFQSYERTLTDSEVNKIMDKVSEKLKSSGWEVR